MTASGRCGVPSTRDMMAGGTRHTDTPTGRKYVAESVFLRVNRLDNPKPLPLLAVVEARGGALAPRASELPPATTFADAVAAALPLPPAAPPLAAVSATVAGEVSMSGPFRKRRKTR